MNRPVPGLGSVSAAPKCQRGDGFLGPFFGQRGNDQHLGALGRLEDARNRFQPADARHFQVEQDDVDHHLAKRLDRVLGSAGDAGNFEIAVGVDHPAEDRAGDHRIVDDHQLDRPARLPGGSSPVAGP